MHPGTQSVMGLYTISTNDPALVWHWKVQFLLCLKIDDLLKKLVLSEAMRTHASEDSRLMINVWKSRD